MEQAAALAEQAAATQLQTAQPRTLPHMRAQTPLQREVFGFVNASNLGNPNLGYPSWNFGLLSVVAFFGLQVNSGDGHLVTTNNTGWDVYHSATMTNFVNQAHINGTKVIVSINLHDFSTSPTNQVCQGLILANTQNTISETLREVAAAGIDGINVNYEAQDTVCANGLTARSQMTTFVKNLKAAMPPSAYLAVDTYSGSAEDNLEFFDVTGISPYVTSMFVMAYDMDYDNSTQPPLNCAAYCYNPVSPLNTYRFNVTKSMNQYLALVPASKIILGQPYYGRRGCGASLNDAHQLRTPNTNFVATTYQFASTVATQPGVFSFSRHRDPSEGYSEWDTWFDTDWNCNREQYFDDVISLGIKYDLVNTDNLRGVGLFALDYAGGAPEVWDVLAAKFTTVTPWESIGGVTSSSPDSSAGAPNVLDMFTRGSDNTLWHSHWNGTSWGTWESLGGLLTSSPSAVSWGVNRTDVFVRGSDDALYHKAWSGNSWGPWEYLGGTLTSGPDAASWSSGRIDVAVRGSDYQLYHKFYDSSSIGWSNWEALGGGLTSDPSAISWGPKRLDLFARGTDNQLYHRFYDGSSIGWSNWESLGGGLESGPDASSCGSRHLDVFAVGTDHGIWQKGFNGSSWSAWKPLGGRFTADPSAVCIAGTQTVALFARGIDAAVWWTKTPAS
jgi:spore germination protein YaaH